MLTLFMTKAKGKFRKNLNTLQKECASLNAKIEDIVGKSKTSDFQMNKKLNNWSS